MGRAQSLTKARRVVAGSLTGQSQAQRSGVSYGERITAKNYENDTQEKQMRAVNTKPQGNRRIKRASGFHRAWLIADQLNRLQDSAGAILTQALVTQWLSQQRRWA
jgi:hypothetical protein